jgi:phosphatidylglycerophosphate synthase
MEPGSVVSLPNAISLARMVLAPAMVVIAWQQEQNMFRAAFTAAVISDLVDGLLAQFLNQRTEFGAKLDSWADMSIYLALFFGNCLLWPDFINAHLDLLLGGFGVYTAAFGFGYLKYGRLTSYHTLGGKLSAVLMACSMILWFFGGPDWPFRLALVIALASGIEQIGITAVLPYWRPNVLSLCHALLFRRGTK